MSDFIDIKQELSNLLNEETKQGRVVAFFIQGLIVISLLSLALQTVPGLPQHAHDIFEWISIICMFVFVTEYSLRVYTAKKVHKYIFSFYGLVDIVAIAPYFLGLGGIDASSLRAFRLMRIFQLFKLVRYSKAIARFKSAFFIAKEELMFFGLIALIIFFLSSVGIYHFEHEAQPEAFASIVHSLWWSIITLTTIGYGDIYPITVAGKVFTGVIVLVGLGVVSVPAGILASALSEARNTEIKEE